MNYLKSIVLGVTLLTLLTTPAFSAAKPAPAEKGFHGIQSGDIETLKYIESQCPALIKQWLIVRDLHSEVYPLYRVFGTTEKKAAEARLKKVLPKLDTTRAKYHQLFKTCDDGMTKKLVSSTKKLKSLQKKKTLSPSAKKKIEDLQTEISHIKKAPAALKRINPSNYSVRVPNEMQRLKVNAGEVAQTQLISAAPNVAKLRMTLQDKIADIKRIDAKGADKLTAADKQKKKRALQQLKVTYARLEKACTTYKKKITIELNKYEKTQKSIIAKIEKAEKAHRNTDKLDTERLKLIQEISTINYQVDITDKILADSEAKKLLSIPK